MLRTPELCSTLKFGSRSCETLRMYNILYCTISHRYVQLADWVTYSESYVSPVLKHHECQWGMNANLLMRYVRRSRRDISKAEVGQRIQNGRQRGRCSGQFGNLLKIRGCAQLCVHATWDREKCRRVTTGRFIKKRNTSKMWQTRLRTRAHFSPHKIPLPRVNPASRQRDSAARED